MEFFIGLIIAGIVAAAKYAAAHDATKDAAKDAAQPSEPQTWEEVPPVMQTVQEAASPLTPKGPSRTGRKRAQMAQTELWSAAKRQQDDAKQVHAIHMDTCESRLQSLRTLYDAGILDREEYAQRVARVKAQHVKGAS